MTLGVLLLASVATFSGPPQVTTPQPETLRPCTQAKPSAKQSADALNNAKSLLKQGVRDICLDSGSNSTQEDDTHVCPNQYVMAGSTMDNKFVCLYAGPLTDFYIATGASAEEQFSSNGYSSLRCKAGWVARGMNVLKNQMRCAKMPTTILAPTGTVLVNVSGAAPVCGPTTLPNVLHVMIGWNQMRSQMVCETANAK